MTTSSRRLFDTYTGYRMVILELLAQANRQIVLFDPDLSQCGLESPASIEAVNDPRGKISFDDTRSASRFLAQFESLWERGQNGPSVAPLGI